MSGAESEARGRGIIVTLTPQERTIATFIGCMRETDANAREREDYYPNDESNGAHRHIRGCGGEMAGAKALNIYWSGTIGEVGAPDVGRLQIRTRPEPDDDLCVRARDPNDAVYVLVIPETDDSYRIVGWKRGADAKDWRYHHRTQKGHDLYFVPQADLEPFDREALRRMALFVRAQRGER